MPLPAFQLNFLLIYLIYGLAFFTMGLALMLESGRSPLLVERRTLWLLALFGLLHGAHEWIEIILSLVVWLGAPFPPTFEWVRVVWLIVSFVPLLLFGMFQQRSKAPFYIGCGLLMIYPIMVLVYLQLQIPDTARWLDVLSRYHIATPAGLLAGYAFWMRSRQVTSEQRLQLASHLRWAAGGMAVYGVTQVFVPYLEIFPANWINSQAFLAMMGFPVQTVRAGMAVIVTVALLRAIQFVEQERQQQLLAAQQARLEALEQVQQELVAREQMRRELLRHTVIAQEDERARIARELHDETAQILTAISLNLATLSKFAGTEAAEFLDRLQNLARQMSRGIYRLVHDLRPAQLDDLGLVPALQYLTEQEHKRNGLVVQFDVEGDRRRLDPLVETVIFRIAQEALTNVNRHAQVNRAEMKMSFLADEVNFQVKDGGQGFDPAQKLVPPHGWGLAGMRERVESLGGCLNIQAAPGQGTMIEAAIPVADPGDE
ncbi:MAG: sensor histidine kinase [Anaerolineales bacterium]|jgi:signal transduction histidine kinase